jgi:hypothetical protein
MKKVLLFSILTAFLFLACEDKEQPTPIPNPTPYVNKFNCKINGKYWEVIPKALYRPIQYNTLIAELQFRDSIVWLWADNEKANEDIIFFIPIYNRADTIKMISANSFNKDGCGEHKINLERPSYFIISDNDKSKRILKGKFVFQSYSNSCKDTVKVTDGFFDIKY